MEIKDIVTIVTSLGFGYCLRVFWDRYNTIQLQKQETKEARYKCIILLLLCYLDFERHKEGLHRNQYQYINRIEDLKDLLILERENMILYGSKEVINSMAKFIDNPTTNNFYTTSLAMRKDLWGNRWFNKIKYDELLKVIP